MAEQNPISTTLGSRLRDQFTSVRGDRLYLEERWLRDARQVKGLYDPEEEQRLDKNRSRTFVRMTRTKVKAATARMMDLVFPAGSDDNWSLQPTPNPELDIQEEVMQFMQQTGQMPTEEDIEMLTYTKAKERAEDMQRTIKDQLAEIRYRRVMHSVIESGNLYGTGILKGPLINKIPKQSWVMTPDGQWQPTMEVINKPFIEFTPIWELYPDSSASWFRDARFCYQRSLMPRHRLLEMLRRPDFAGATEQVREYLKTHPNGDSLPLDWELELRRIGWNLNGVRPNVKQYEILEYWGALSAQELIEIGVPVPDDSLGEYWTNIWLLGPHIIKSSVQPIEGMTLPYYAYYWDKDETCIFGEGLASIIRDDQKGLNAATRAMLDNAAVCAGPMFEANVDLLHPDEDPRDIHAFRVFLRQGVGGDASFPAIREIGVSSHTAEYLSIAQSFATNIHESTIPSYMHGEATSKGSVGRTVGGLSMLMSAAQITFKDQLFSIDDDVQRPFLEAMYFWNMQFNPDESIKGDFNVVIKGTSSLVAQEVRAQNLEQFAQSTANPLDQPFINRLELNKQRARVLELGPGIVNTPEDIKYSQVIYPLLENEPGTQQSLPTPTAGMQSPSAYGGGTSDVETAQPQDGGPTGQTPFGGGLRPNTADTIGG